jgi:hypothetical protein
MAGFLGEGERLARTGGEAIGADPVGLGEDRRDAGLRLGRFVYLAHQHAPLGGAAVAHLLQQLRLAGHLVIAGRRYRPQREIAVALLGRDDRAIGGVGIGVVDRARMQVEAAELGAALDEDLELVDRVEMAGDHMAGAGADEEGLRIVAVDLAPPR